MKIMDTSEIIKEMKKLEEPKYLMGTKAYHLLGDISSDEPDILYVSFETEKYYIGSWITGFGFFNVCFPKETTRELTKEEYNKYNKMYIQIGSMSPTKLM